MPLNVSIPSPLGGPYSDEIAGVDVAGMDSDGVIE